MINNQNSNNNFINIKIVWILIIKLTINNKNL